MSDGGSGGRLPTPAKAGPQKPADPTSTHTLPSPPPPSWGFTLCPLSPALGVTPPVRIESSSSHVAEGQTLDLNCLVSGQPHAQVTWHKRGGSLPARHQVRDWRRDRPRRGREGGPWEGEVRGGRAGGSSEAERPWTPLRRCVMRCSEPRRSDRSAQVECDCRFPHLVVWANHSISL